MESLDRAVQQVKEGDPAAFEVIVNATSGKLVRLAARLVGSVAEAEDVVQEAYLKAFRAITSGGFDGRSSVETWLHRIVVNGAIDQARARARRPTDRASDLDLAAEPASGVAAAEARVALAELADFLADLPEDQRVALTLTAVEGRSAAEVAELLGVSEGAIEQRVVRARARLKARLNADPTRRR